MEISNYMSEHFAEDEESKRNTIKKGTFMEEGDEQNDLMMDDPEMTKMAGPKDSLSDYN
jgi:hypothetical protein